jgi:uncharacterized membrane-anchored protein
VVGDFLDKPISKGGLQLSRYSASAVLLTAIAICIFSFLTDLPDARTEERNRH